LRRWGISPRRSIRVEGHRLRRDTDELSTPSSGPVDLPVDPLLQTWTGRDGEGDEGPRPARDDRRRTAIGLPDSVIPRHHRLDLIPRHATGSLEDLTGDRDDDRLPGPRPTYAGRGRAGGVPPGPPMTVSGVGFPLERRPRKRVDPRGDRRDDLIFRPRGPHPVEVGGDSRRPSVVSDHVRADLSSGRGTPLVDPQLISVDTGDDEIGPIVAEGRLRGDAPIVVPRLHPFPGVEVIASDHRLFTGPRDTEDIGDIAHDGQTIARIEVDRESPIERPVRVDDLDIVVGGVPVDIERSDPFIAPFLETGSRDVRFDIGVKVRDVRDLFPPRSPHRRRDRSDDAGLEGEPTAGADGPVEELEIVDVRPLDLD